MTLLRLLLVTKFHHWAYEQELRVIVNLAEATRESGLYFFPFCERLRLREVILGRCAQRPTTSQLRPIRTLTRATNMGALVSKARLGFKYFEVKEDGHYPPK